MLDLAGKNVWITGASSGLGAALAQQCLDAGARVLLSARRVERLQEVARGRANVALLPLDLAALDTLADKTAEALQAMGSIDVMIHNAGVGQRALVSESSFAVDRHLMDVNFLGPVALTKALLPSMLTQKSGHFVVISSVLGLMSMKRRAGYCASKHALHGYFNALRAEVHQDGLRVLLVCPGHIDSEFSQAALSADGRANGVNEAHSRAGLSPEECARTTLRALRRGSAEVYPAKWESVGVYLNRYAPGLMRRAVASMKAR
ncbi:MAG TPA: SDR family NAD(P)-dependent oxidoreductase [Polyangiales bacterium]